MGKLIVESQADVRNLKPAFWSQVQRAVAAHRCGVRIVSAWRSYAKQAYLYALFKAGIGNPANPPGTSTHEKGLAVDAHPEDGNYAALNDTMRQFGIIGDKPAELWHFEGTVTSTSQTQPSETGAIPIWGFVTFGVLVAGTLAYVAYAGSRKG